VLATLAPLAAPSRNDLVPLLDDPAIEVRRAAIDLVDPSLVDALTRVVERESDPAVASGAAAVLCPRLPRSAAGAWTRLRTLVLQAKIDPADALDLLACLAAGSADDRAVVAQAAKSHPTAFVRAAAVDLYKSPGPPPLLREVSAPR
jgi:hypothetical protein